MNFETETSKLAAQISTQMPNPPVSGSFLEDVAELNHQRMIAREIASSQVGEQIAAARPLEAKEFWQTWVATNEAPMVLSRVLEILPSYEAMWETHREQYGPTGSDEAIMLGMEWEEYLPKPVENPNDPAQAADYQEEVEYLLDGLVQALHAKLNLIGVEWLKNNLTIVSKTTKETSLQQVLNIITWGTGPMEKLALIERPEGFKEVMNTFLQSWEWETISNGDLPANLWIRQWEVETGGNLIDLELELEKLAGLGTAINQ